MPSAHNLSRLPVSPSPPLSLASSPAMLTIWTNALFADAENRLLAEGTRRHKVVYAPDSTKFFLGSAAPDPALGAFLAVAGANTA